MMTADDLVTIRHAFRVDQDLLAVEAVEVLGKSARNGDLIVKLPSGAATTEGAYNLYATRNLAVSALREELTHNIDYWRKRVVVMEAALSRLPAPTDDDQDDATVEFPPPEYGEPVAKTPVVDVHSRTLEQEVA